MRRKSMKPTARERVEAALTETPSTVGTVAGRAGVSLNTAAGWLGEMSLKGRGHGQARGFRAYDVDRRKRTFYVRGPAWGHHAIILTDGTIAACAWDPSSVAELAAETEQRNASGDRPGELRIIVRSDCPLCTPSSDGLRFCT